MLTGLAPHFLMLSGYSQRAFIVATQGIENLRAMKTLLLFLPCFVAFAGHAQVPAPAVRTDSAIHLNVVPNGRYSHTFYTVNQEPLTTKTVTQLLRRYSPAAEVGMWCTALGLVCVAVGSAWFHFDPTDSTLFWDRLPMTLVFAGILGAAIAQRVGNSEGRMGLVLLVPLGIASVIYWKMTGDLSPYATLQFGGIAGLLALLALTRRGNDPFPWRWVVAWYVFAKIAESLDQQIWDATQGMIAGHTIKHLLAAAAGAAALWPCFIVTSASRGAS